MQSGKGLLHSSSPLHFSSSNNPSFFFSSFDAPPASEPTVPLYRSLRRKINEGPREKTRNGEFAVSYYVCMLENGGLSLQAESHPGQMYRCRRQDA